MMPVASGYDSETVIETRGQAVQEDLVVSDLPKLQNEMAGALLALFLLRQDGLAKSGHDSRQHGAATLCLPGGAPFAIHTGHV